jgi:hypothetical protein
VKTGDIIGIVLLVMLPIFFGVLLWALLRVPPRRLRERTDELARTLGLSVIEPGVTRGVRNGRNVEVVLGMSASFGRGGRPRTSCRVYLDPPFATPFVVGLPRNQTAGTTTRWEDVGIGGPTPESRALATSLAPLVRSYAGRLDGVLVIEVDRATSAVSLDGCVLDRDRLEQALALAEELASAVTAHPR